jgi:hypothetical protein
MAIFETKIDNLAFFGLKIIRLNQLIQLIVARKLFGIFNLKQLIPHIGKFSPCRIDLLRRWD